MTLYEELYFEITLTGPKAELKRFAKYLTSGELDDFFDISDEYLSYADDFADVEEDKETEIVFTNDDIGVEISSFNPEEFLDVFCKAAKNLDVSGHFYDIDDEEYTFVSAAGEAYYKSGKDADFNDELDAEAEKEDAIDD